MHLKLKDQKLKESCLYTVLKLHGNHTLKIYNRNTHEKEKQIETEH